MAPWVHFSVNQEYIKTHLCESLTDPDLKDCDGYCYLKKQVKEHHQEHGAEHSDTMVMRDFPIFLFYSQVQNYYLVKDFYSKKMLLLNDLMAQQVYIEPLSPPPKG